MCESPILQPRAKEGDQPTTHQTRQPPTSPQISILHHTPGRYIAVNKPADVRIDGDFTHTVSKLVITHLSTTAQHPTAPPNPRFIQRLDYATSGVLLIGLCRRAAALAARQFERREVRKEYLALVHGWLTDARTFDSAIADTIPRGFRMTTGTSSNPGRSALTNLIPLCKAWYLGARVTKVRLEARSGRRHQLRVHCAGGGVPIVGDATYVEGEGERYFGDDEVVPPRMMLHARLLEVRLAEGDGWGELVRTVLDAGDPFVPAELPGLELLGRGSTSVV
eukprot:GFKZ01006021.1.p1 GENE.GFKZ01006021.1~~GFKZ01006021.1.p1  ORF type:complete len:308 (+),score=16.44 GFKZ01006021.1:88-924(+)